MSWFSTLNSAFTSAQQAADLGDRAVQKVVETYGGINLAENDSDRTTDNLIKILAGKSLVNSELVGQGAALNQKDLESNNPELEALLGSPQNGEVVLSYPENILDEDVNHVMLFQMYEREDESRRIASRELNRLFDPSNSTWYADGINQIANSLERVGTESDFVNLDSIGGLNRDSLTRDELNLAFSRIQQINSASYNTLRYNTEGVPEQTLTPEGAFGELADQFFTPDLQDRNNRSRLSNSSYSNRFKQPFVRRTLEQSPKFKSKQSIFLYMPSAINETNIQSYDNADLLLATFASKAFKELVNAGSQDINALTTELIKQIENAGAAGALSLAGLADAAVNILGIPLNAQQALTQLTGLAINPRKEQIYKSPEPRTFNYVFELYPRSRRETEMVNSMIRMFKYHAAPDLDASGNVFVTPATFRIKYLYKNSGALTENIFLNRIKDCVLTEVNVDYTSPGKFTSFRDGSPVGVKLSLTFREIETVVKQDILDGA